MATVFQSNAKKKKMIQTRIELMASTKKAKEQCAFRSQGRIWTASKALRTSG
jgi:hypothetical protein